MPIFRESVPNIHFFSDLVSDRGDKAGTWGPPSIEEADTVWVGALLGTYAVYSILLVVLLWRFTHTSGWAWYFVLSTVFLGAVAVVRSIVNADPKSTIPHHPAYKYVPLASYLAAALHLYGLGYVTADYQYRHVLFGWVFPFMFFVVCVAISVHGWRQLVHENTTVNDPVSAQPTRRNHKLDDNMTAPLPSAPPAPPPQYTAVGAFLGWDE